MKAQIYPNEGVISIDSIAGKVELTITTVDESALIYLSPAEADMFALLIRQACFEASVQRDEKALKEVR